MPLGQGQRTVIKQLQNNEKNGPLSVPTGNLWLPKIQKQLCLALTHCSHQSSLFSMSFSVFHPLWRGHEPNYPALSSHQLQGEQSPCIVRALSGSICLPSVLQQPLSPCCPPSSQLHSWNQSRREHKEAIRGWEQLPNVAQRGIWGNIMESLMSNCPAGPHLQAVCSCSRHRPDQVSRTALISALAWCTCPLVLNVSSIKRKNPNKTCGLWESGHDETALGETKTRGRNKASLLNDKWRELAPACNYNTNLKQWSQATWSKCNCVLFHIQLPSCAMRNREWAQ